MLLRYYCCLTGLTIPLPCLGKRAIQICYINQNKFELYFVVVRSFDAISAQNSDFSSYCLEDEGK